MLEKTKGIVLRSVKYGDNSLITTIFTAQHGVQAYIVQGIRSSKTGKNRSSLLQPGMLLELVIYFHPQKNLQRIREFQLAHVYDSHSEHIIRNSIILFSVELLLRLLPENASMPELFDFAYEYLIMLDKTSLSSVANFPLYFITKCSVMCGFGLKEIYSSLSQPDNTRHWEPISSAIPAISDKEIKTLNAVLAANSYDEIKTIEMNANMRLYLIDWYISFLQNHSQHMGKIKSLPILRTILH